MLNRESPAVEHPIADAPREQAGQGAERAVEPNAAATSAPDDLDAGQPNLLAPVHRWVWSNPRRRALNLLRFAEVEAAGGRDLVRASETTADPLLRRLFLVHAADEQRHADLFRQQGLTLLRSLAPAERGAASVDWLAPGERGLDDLQVEREGDAALLAFLHLSEKTAAQDFARYIAVLQADPQTREVFQRVLHDEAFHMRYTLAQLRRVAPDTHRKVLWKGRLGRIWKAYLRLAGGLAAVMGSVLLTVQYYLLLPPFALLAKRNARKDPDGWSPIAPQRNGALTQQY
jgi:rubrerythrin